MDLDMLLRRNARALMLQARAGNDEDRRAYRQFAGDYSVPIEVESAAPSARSSDLGLEPELNDRENRMSSYDDQPGEGGHMSSRFGRIVRTSDVNLPYKAILTHDECAETERSFATMQEAEAFVRRNTPRPRARNAFWDRDAPSG